MLKNELANFEAGTFGAPANTHTHREIDSYTQRKREAGKQAWA